jgi:hypothetical protein
VVRALTRFPRVFLALAELLQASINRPSGNA